MEKKTKKSNPKATSRPSGVPPMLWKELVKFIVLGKKLSKRHDRSKLS